jgi:hypothetical protein
MVLGLPGIAFDQYLDLQQKNNLAARRSHCQIPKLQTQII